MFHVERLYWLSCMYQSVWILAIKGRMHLSYGERPVCPRITHPELSYALLGKRKRHIHSSRRGVQVLASSRTDDYKLAAID